MRGWLPVLMIAGMIPSAQAVYAAPAGATRPSAWALAFRADRALPAARAAGYAVAPYRPTGRGDARYSTIGRSPLGGVFRASGPDARRIGRIAFSIELKGGANAQKRRFADSIALFLRRAGVTERVSLDAVREELDADGFHGDETENIPSSTTVEKLAGGARRITYVLLPPTPAPGNN